MIRMTSARSLRPLSDISLLALGLLFAGLFFTSTAQIETGLPSIRQEELEEKLTFFASRDFKGRGNGTPDLNRAAEYIAEGFKKNGVLPAGDRNTYFQSFEMFRSELGSGNKVQLLQGNSTENLVLGSEFVPYHLSPSGDIRGPLVFLGFGVSAPHLKFDEFEGVNLKGKVAVVIDGHPRLSDQTSPFNKIHVSDFGSVQSKAKRAYDAGAVGLIVVQNARSSYGLRIGQLADMFQSGYPLRFAPMGSASDPDNPRLPVVIVSAETGKKFVDQISELQKEIDETLKPRPVESLDTVTISVNVVRVTFAAQNVVGLIPGSHPELRNEFVIVGAHYDHDGEYNGQIWQGADDNGSGTVALLELAEAFGSGSTKPARSILLCAWAGEEKGLIGSSHYASHPARPLQRSVAMIQMDMIGRNEEHAENRRLGLQRERSSENTNMVNLIGSSFSADLRRDIEEANSSIGLTLKFRYDDTPEDLLRRSDQWPFLQKGVPAMFFHTGEHPDYHTPRDTPDKINYPKLEKITRLVFLTTQDLANSPTRPRYTNPY